MAKKSRLLIHILLTVIFIVVGAVGLVVLTQSKHPMARKKSKPIVPVVRVIKAELVSRRIVVHGEGSVAPVHQSTLAAEVKGRTVYISPSLIAGGQFKKGQTLLKIDKMDFELSLTLARAKVQEARTSLQTVKEESAAAQEEWKKFRSKKDPVKPPPLLVKEPQIADAQARLLASQAQFKQAELNLARTEVKAPYDGRVVEQFADLGQYLRAGDKIANVFSTKAVEITVQLEDKELAWLTVPGFTSESGQGSSAKIIAEFAGQLRVWHGVVTRAQGELDRRTRMAPVVVRVEHPYAKLPPLAVGLFVAVEIQGTDLEKAALIPRAAMRQGGIVWVVNSEDRLKFRPVTMVRSQGDDILISKGLKQGDQVVISTLGAVSDGMAVKIRPQSNPEGKEASS